MNKTYKEYVESQFEVSIVTEGPRKGRVLFKTPLADYTLSAETWSVVKEKINKVNL